jgi:four helix bundle protein
MLTAQSGYCSPDEMTYSARMMPYERLKAWKVSHELALETYRQTETWPRTELFGLTSQTRRAALSIPTNIAEGAAKLGPREFRRFLDMSLGSLSELSYLLLFSRERGFLSIEDWKHLESHRNRAGQLIWCLYRSIQRSALAKE